MSDNLWDVRVREKEEEDTLRRQLAKIDSEIVTARKSSALRNSPGFADLVKSIETLRESSVNALIMDTTLTNDGLREQRGIARALSRVLALMLSDKAADRLEANKQIVQNMLDEALKRRPKPKPQEAQT